MNGDWIWCDGEFLEAGRFTLSPWDRGLTVGMGVFETMLAIDGVPAFFGMHISRLERSGSLVIPGYPASAGHPDGEIRQATVELLRRNGHDTGRARVRLSLTAGDGPLDRADTIIPGRIWIMTSTTPEPPETLRVAVCPWTRDPGRALAGIKCASWAENVMALRWARDHDADESLFLTPDGRISECATSNLFIVRGGGVVTPGLASGCLPGICRAAALELCRNHHISAGECDLTMADLRAADAIFLTSSLRGVVSVRSLDGHPVPTDPLVSSLRERVHQMAIQPLQSCGDAV